MSVMRRLWNYFRGQVNGRAENFLDNGGITEVEQELRDARGKLRTAEKHMEDVLGREIVAKSKLDAEWEAIAKDEGRLDAILAKIDSGEGSRETESLAMELANRIAERQAQFEANKVLYEKHVAVRNNAEAAVTAMRDNLDQLAREVSEVKTTHTIQTAQKAIYDHGSGARDAAGNIRISLDRVRERQAGFDASVTTMIETDRRLSGSDLDSRLAAAGLIESKPTGTIVLERIRRERADKAAAALPAPAATQAIENRSETVESDTKTA